MFTIRIVVSHTSIYIHLGGVGPYPRALCATWDIHTRKTLAAIPTEGETGGIGVFDSREKIVRITSEMKFCPTRVVTIFCR